MNIDKNEVTFENNYAYTSGGAIQILGEYNNLQNKGVKDLLKDQIYKNNTSKFYGHDIATYQKNIQVNYTFLNHTSVMNETMEVKNNYTKDIACPDDNS